MGYEIIQPPFTLQFREMPVQELKEYSAWFHRVIPERVAILEKEVAAAAEFAGWKADRSPDSIEPLGRWFATQVETRPRTASEKEAISSSAPWVTVPDVELTNRTFSIAYDVGIYLALCILAARPSARWDQDLKRKQFVDYGQPTIVGLGVVPLNPIRIAISTAYGISDGRRQASDLKAAFDYWVKQGKK